MSKKSDNYLKEELYELIRSDSKIFDYLQSSSLDGMWYRDLEKSENEWISEGFWALLGYQPSNKESHPRKWKDLVHADDLELVTENLQKHYQDPSYPYDQIIRYTHRDGSTVWVRCRGMAIRDGNGKALRMLGIHQDITQLKVAEDFLLEKNRELITQSRHDFLTGLYNRLAFYEQFQSLGAVAIRQKLPLSLLMMDIDHFKKINDQWGHMRGDEVLQELVKVLKSVARDSDTLARFGGEEFIILLFGANKRSALQASERFRQAVEMHDWGELGNIHISGGITTCLPGDMPARNPGDMELRKICDELTSRADAALYYAKESGRNQSCFYLDNDEFESLN